MAVRKYKGHDGVSMGCITDTFCFRTMKSVIKVKGELNGDPAVEVEVFKAVSEERRKTIEGYGGLKGLAPVAAPVPALAVVAGDSHDH